MKQFFNTLMVVVLMGAASATYAQREVSSKDFSGWLDDYDSLVFDEDRNSFVFFNEDKRGKYDRVLLDTVQVYGKDAEAQGEIAKQASEYLTDGARKVLQERGVLASEPGPGVLRYDMAITGVEKSKEELKAHNVIPVSALFRGAKAATGNLNTYIDAMFEAKLTDSVTGERVAATVRKGIGTTEKKSGDTLEFEDVVPTLDFWLEQYGKTLDEFLAKRK